MANFETWKFDSLVAFAREAQANLAVLEIKLRETNSTALYARITELEETLAECDRDRKDLLTELRKMITSELAP